MRASFLTVSAMLAALGGCASNLIDVRPGSDRIAVAEPAQVAQCKHIGKTTATVLSKVAFYSRSIDQVDADLLQLARNEAVDEGGDTLVPGERPAVGKRVFEIYKCKP